MLLWQRVAQVLPLLLLLELMELPSASAWLKFNSYTALSKKRTDLRKKCPNVSAPIPQSTVWLSQRKSADNWTVERKLLQIEQISVHIINS